MSTDPIAPQTDREDLVADLIEAAYGFVLRHGFKGAFIEVELGLRYALRACQGRIKESASVSAPTGTPPAPHFPVPPPTRQGTNDEAALAFARR